VTASVNGMQSFTVEFRIELMPSASALIFVNQLGVCSLAVSGFTGSMSVRLVGVNVTIPGAASELVIEGG